MITSIITAGVVKAVHELYQLEVLETSIPIDNTRKEFTGDYTIVVFPFTKASKKGPEQTADEIGHFLKTNIEEISDYNIVKGFLNLSVSDAYWTNYLLDIAKNERFGTHPSNGKKVMIEFSSPNTNKPLHLGHVRNILLGWSAVKISESAGYEVIKSKVVNDRGIAICKSMLAWQRLGEGKTPQSTGIKGDHFVGDYYVQFEGVFQAEYKTWQETDEAKMVLETKNPKNLEAAEFFKGYKNLYFNAYSEIGKAAREMLLAWENGDAETVALWKQMNGWVYDGFNETYQTLGVHFDKIYYESDTYVLGKDIIEKGIADQIFYKKEDNSVWIDLTDVKLDQKVVMRGDGTSLYITQDIGMAPVRYADFGVEKMVFVVADEQDYHFKVLFEIMKRLGEPYAAGMYHLSYGMVELPNGRMKSREGTVVDADDLMAEVIKLAKAEGAERGALTDLTPDALDEINRKVGLAAVKYQMIKVQPKKKMIFDPEESVALEGHTGPYIQYPYVRTQGLLRKAKDMSIDMETAHLYADLQPQERDLIQLLYQYPSLVLRAAEDFDPSLIANFAYDLAKAYNKFWAHVPLLKEELTEETKAFRLTLSRTVGETIQKSMALLGIEMPERM
jgi:arginyl-tRNA synthetase